MVIHPGDYRWSSYSSNAQGRNNSVIQPHPLYTHLGDSAAQQQHAYRALFSAHLDKADLHTIREAVNQELVLGREDFKDMIEQMTSRQSRPRIPGRPRVEEQSAIYYVI